VALERKDKAFLGVGWSFPFAFDAAGAVATAAYEEDVRQAITILLGTNRGERLMRPAFGAGLQEFLFAPVSASALEQVRTRVKEALIDWEPRVDVEDVRVAASLSEGNLVEVSIRYRVRATNTLHNLVYPFYLEEGQR